MSTTGAIKSEPFDCILAFYNGAGGTVNHPGGSFVVFDTNSGSPLQITSGFQLYTTKATFAPGDSTQATGGGKRSAFANVDGGVSQWEIDLPLGTHAATSGSAYTFHVTSAQPEDVRPHARPHRRAPRAERLVHRSTSTRRSTLNFRAAAPGSDGAGCARARV